MADCCSPAHPLPQCTMWLSFVLFSDISLYAPLPFLTNIAAFAHPFLNALICSPLLTYLPEILGETPCPPPSSMLRCFLFLLFTYYPPPLHHCSNLFPLLTGLPEMIVASPPTPSSKLQFVFLLFSHIRLKYRGTSGPSLSFVILQLFLFG